MWKTINELMNKSKKDTKISELTTDNNEPIDPTQIPNAFSFSTHYVRPKEKHFPSTFAYTQTHKSVDGRLRVCTCLPS